MVKTKQTNTSHFVSFCIASMAALSIGHFFLTNKRSLSDRHKEMKRKNYPRLGVLVACQSPEPVDIKSSTNTKKKDKRNSKQLFSQLFIGAEKFGKNLKENLSPQQKGDWKDLVLMSLSFAVYVYISQMFVCAYFAWMAMPKQSW